MMGYPTIFLSGAILFFLTFTPPSIHYLKCKKITFPFTKLNDKNFTPEVTILLPMRNESLNVERKIAEISRIDYPSRMMRILVIDSGSDDNTAALARNYLSTMCPNQSWEVISIEKPGKSIAVNEALGAIESEFFVMMDADAYCESDCLRKMMARFSDERIGAVSGMMLVDDGGYDPYRHRFNTIRVAESIQDSTPIFEGSICGFRISSIGSKLLNPDINADDSQLAMIVRSNGFRAVMDPSITFREESKISRKRLLRRSQGLSRILIRNLNLCHSHGKYSTIMIQTVFFYVAMPWMFLSSSALLISGISLMFIEGNIKLALWKKVLIALFSTFLVLKNRTARSFLFGVSISIEAHLRLLFGNRMNVWNPSRVSTTKQK